MLTVTGIITHALQLYFVLTISINHALGFLGEKIKEELQQEWKEKINRSIHGMTITSKTHHWQIKNHENENSTLYI